MERSKRIWFRVVQFVLNVPRDTNQEIKVVKIRSMKLTYKSVGSMTPYTPPNQGSVDVYGLRHRWVKDVSRHVLSLWVHIYTFQPGDIYSQSIGHLWHKSQSQTNFFKYIFVWVCQVPTQQVPSWYDVKVKRLQWYTTTQSPGYVYDKRCEKPTNGFRFSQRTRVINNDEGLQKGLNQIWHKPTTTIINKVIVR